MQEESRRMFRPSRNTKNEPCDQGRSMARNGTPLEAAHASVRALIGEKVRYLVPMTVVFMTAYVGLTALAGFAKGLVGIKVIGSVHFGFVLFALHYSLFGACFFF